MRMDTSAGRLRQSGLLRLQKINWNGDKEYGEERFARQIARAIIVARARQPIVTTLQLAEIIAAVVRTRQRQRENMRHPRRALFRRYGFISIKSLRSCR